VCVACCYLNNKLINWREEEGEEGGEERNIL
jgi:hypothetical protein